MDTCRQSGARDDDDLPQHQPPTAAVASRSVQALLFGVEPIDPASLAIGGATMFVIAIAAGFVPARRAARLDPLALRRESSGP